MSFIQRVFLFCPLLGVSEVLLYSCIKTPGCANKFLDKSSYYRTRTLQITSVSTKGTIRGLNFSFSYSANTFLTSEERSKGLPPRVVVVRRFTVKHIPNIFSSFFMASTDSPHLTFSEASPPTSLLAKEMVWAVASASFWHFSLAAVAFSKEAVSSAKFSSSSWKQYFQLQTKPIYSGPPNNGHFCAGRIACP